MTTDLHNAIETTLRAAFTEEELPTCIKYPELSGRIIGPAVLIEMSELSPGTDPGTGELAMTARFTAYAVLQRSSRSMIDAANLAVAVAFNVFKAGRFGEDVGASQIVRVAQDQFKPELFNYSVWAVEWTHEIHLGTSVWTGEGVIPSELYVGFAPEIGIGHEPDYIQVIDE